MREVLDMSEEERAVWRTRAVQRVRERYDWEVITTRYESMLLEL